MGIDPHCLSKIMYTRVPPYCQFLDAILGCLTKDVAEQYKVNAKNNRFLSHEMSRRRTVPFLPILGKKAARCDDFLA